MPNVEIKPEKFEFTNLPGFDRKLSRGAIDKQIAKVCYSCNKPLNKRKKGRNKYQSLTNVPGRFVCESCAIKLANGQAVQGIKFL
jgi:hypothetical protein